ncbi:MAG TPA: DUF2087 domain-containing protein [Bacillota bacterium]|nr:DUF2087 domain-containing protein [Bacillota bacterium]
MYPARQKYKILSLFCLALKFEAGRIYNEKEVNQILMQWHTYGDWAMLRREPYDKGFLNRKSDRTAYWLEEKQPTLSSSGLELEACRK